MWTEHSEGKYTHTHTHTHTHLHMFIDVTHLYRVRMDG